MSSASRKGPKFAMMVVGGLTALGMYIVGVRPYFEKKSMERFEAEARQLYVMSRNQRQMAEQQRRNSFTPSSSSQAET